MKKFKIYEYLLSEYTDSSVKPQLVGEIEANSVEEAHQLAKVAFPNSQCHRIEEDKNIYELRGMNIELSKLL